MIIPRSLHVATDGNISFFFMAKKYSVVDMYHIFFIHSPVDGHIGYFQVLVIVNSATMNTGLPVSFLFRVERIFDYSLQNPKHCLIRS